MRGPCMRPEAPDSSRVVFRSSDEGIQRSGVKLESGFLYPEE